MEFTHEFKVPVDPDTAFAVLTDVERVTPCLPGATLDERDGDTFTGRLRIKVGPISVSYQGQAEMTDVDPQARRVTIVAKGKEGRGSGTASARVAMSLEPDGEGTLVTVASDVDVTGKPAQFGRGVMADVGGRILEKFANSLAGQLDGQPTDFSQPGSPATAAHPQSASASVAQSSNFEPPLNDPIPGFPPSQSAPAVAHLADSGLDETRHEDDNALDAMDLVLPILRERRNVLLGALAGILALILAYRSGRRRGSRKPGDPSSNPQVRQKNVWGVTFRTGSPT